MASIFDLVTANTIAAFYEELASNRIPFLGEALFPAEKRVGLKLEWIKGQGGLPIALQPSAFDAKPLLRDRGGVAQESTRMPFFREAMRLGEEDRQQLLMFADNNRNNPYAEQFMARIMDDAKSLIDGAMVTPEIMRMALISNGQFTMASANDSGQTVSYDYNFDPNGTWAAANNVTLLGNARWSDHVNSTPMQDIEARQRIARRYGVRLDRMVVGWDTWMDLVANQNIKMSIIPGADASTYVSDGQVRSYIETNLNIRIEIYDKMYIGLDKAVASFYPSRGCATLMPSVTLGRTCYGTPPEEADLMSGNTLADVRMVNTGVAVSTEKIALPVNLITWVSEIVLPSFENMDMVYNIKYTAD